MCKMFTGISGILLPSLRYFDYIFNDGDRASPGYEVDIRDFIRISPYINPLVFGKNIDSLFLPFCLYTHDFPTTFWINIWMNILQLYLV